MKYKILELMCSPITFWCKENRSIFFESIKNGILLYVLYFIIFLSAKHYEAAGFFDFVFSKMIIIIYFASFSLSITFCLFSFLYKGLFLDLIFLFLSKQFNSLMFFSHTAILVAIGFIFCNFLISLFIGGAWIEFVFLLFVIFQFAIGTCLYKISSWTLAYRQKCATI